MMKRKNKALVEKHVEKIVKKKPMSKVENQKMLQWTKMDSNELKWARRANLESLFNLQWTMPKKDLLLDFL
jgi:hypothetical protein